jgi:adenylate cyclase
VLLSVLGFDASFEHDPANRRPILKSILRSLLTRLIDAEPLVLVIEDVHWADPPSVELLAELVSELSAARWILLATARPGGRDWWSAERLHLQPLPEAAARGIAADLLGASPTPNLASQLVAQSGGNPFFIEELVESLQESDGLVRRDGDVDVKVGGRSVLPATVQAVLQARLDRLPRGPKALVEHAAVCGLQFELPVIEHILIGEDVADDVQVLEREAFVGAALSPGQYAFRHGLIQEVAYQSQLRSRRRRLHTRIGAALEAVYPEHVAEMADQLAFHYRRGDDDAKAVYWLTRAADRARGLYANDQALELYAAALQRLPDGRSSLEACAILERIADIQNLTGHYDDAISSLRKVPSVLSVSDPMLLARIERKIGTALRMKGLYPEASAALETALRLSETRLDIEGAYVRLQIGEMAWRTGQFAQARTAFSDAARLADELQRDDVLAECYKQMGNIPLHAGNPREAGEYLRRSQAIYERLEDLAGIAAVRLNLGVVYGRLGMWDECLSELNASRELHQRIGDVWHLGLVYNNIGEVHRARGEFAQAIAPFEQALAIFTDIGEFSWCATVLTGLGMARIDAGEVAQGRAELLQAEAKFAELGSSMFMPDIYRFLASAELVLGDLDAASGYAQRSLDFARDADVQHQQAMTQRVMAEIALARGDPAAARELLETALATLAEVGEAAELARAEAVLRSLNLGSGQPE